jgi:hypothetical protein
VKPGPASWFYLFQGTQEHISQLPLAFQREEDDHTALPFLKLHLGIPDAISAAVQQHKHNSYLHEFKLIYATLIADSY